MTPRQRFILPAVVALLGCALVAVAGRRAGLAQDPTTVQPGTAAIWTDRQDYNIGDSVTVCYRIPIAGQITISNIPPGNQPIFYSGESSGTSGCLPGIITPPAGRQCLRLSYPLFGGQGQTQDCFTVEGSSPVTPLAIYVNPAQSVYSLGQGIDVCYRVPAPGPIRIIDQIEENTPTTFFSGYDDGTGGCIPGTITPPVGGRECLTIVFTYQADGGEAHAQTCFQTQ